MVQTTFSFIIDLLAAKVTKVASTSSPEDIGIAPALLTKFPPALLHILTNLTKNNRNLMGNLFVQAT